MNTPVILHGFCAYRGVPGWFVERYDDSDRDRQLIAGPYKTKAEATAAIRKYHKEWA